MRRATFLFEMFKIFVSRIVDPLKNMKIHPRRPPPEIQEPWDHAQMIERKILFRIALSRASYDQIRP